MRVCDYSKLAQRTSPKGPLNYRLVHASLGMSSELAELLEGNYLEEIGDTFWYLNEACDALGVELDEIEVIYEADLDPLYRLPFLMGLFANEVKRLVYYEKGNTEEMVELLAKIKVELFELASSEELDIEDILEKNIMKLEKRYPELRFERERAINRNLQAERKVLDE